MRPLLVLLLGGLLMIAGTDRPGAQDGAAPVLGDALVVEPEAGDVGPGADGGPAAAEDDGMDDAGAPENASPPDAADSIEQSPGEAAEEAAIAPAPPDAPGDAAGASSGAQGAEEPAANADDIMPDGAGTAEEAEADTLPPGDAADDDGTRRRAFVVPPDSGEPVSVAPGVVLPALSVMRETRDRPLFSRSRRPPPPPEEPVAEAPPPPPAEEGPSEPPFELAGIVAGGGAQFAMLRNRDKQTVESARQGAVLEGWTLAEIGARHVVLKQDEHAVRLTLFEFKDGKPVRPATPIPDSDEFEDEEDNAAAERASRRRQQQRQERIRAQRERSERSAN
jgi:hypothetical protein